MAGQDDILINVRVDGTDQSVARLNQLQQATQNVSGKMAALGTAGTQAALGLEKTAAKTALSTAEMGTGAFVLKRFFDGFKQGHEEAATAAAAAEKPILKAGTAIRSLSLGTRAADVTSFAGALGVMARGARLSGNSMEGLSRIAPILVAGLGIGVAGAFFKAGKSAIEAQEGFQDAASAARVSEKDYRPLKGTLAAMGVTGDKAGKVFKVIGDQIDDANEAAAKLGQTFGKDGGVLTDIIRGGTGPGGIGRSAPLKGLLSGATTEEIAAFEKQTEKLSAAANASRVPLTDMQKLFAGLPRALNPVTGAMELTDQSFNVLAERAKNLPPIMEKMKNGIIRASTDGLSGARKLFTDAFGPEIAQKILPFFLKGAQGVEDLRKEFPGLAKDIGLTTEQIRAYDLASAQMSNAWDNVKIALAGAFAPGITEGLGELAKFFNENQKGAQELGRTFATSVTPFIKDFFKLFTGAPPETEFFQGLKAFGQEIGPILTELGTAFQSTRTNIKEVVQDFQDGKQKVLDFWKALTGGDPTDASRGGDLMGRIVTDAINAIKKPFEDAAKEKADLGKGLWDGIKDGASAASDAVNGAFEKITGDSRTVGERLRDLLKDFLSLGKGAGTVEQSADGVATKMGDFNSVADDTGGSSGRAVEGLGKLDESFKTLGGTLGGKENPIVAAILGIPQALQAIVGGAESASTGIGRVLGRLIDLAKATTEAFGAMIEAAKKAGQAGEALKPTVQSLSAATPPPAGFSLEKALEKGGAPLSNNIEDRRTDDAKQFDQIINRITSDLGQMNSADVSGLSGKFDALKETASQLGQAIQQGLGSGLNLEGVTQQLQQFQQTLQQVIQGISSGLNLESVTQQLQQFQQTLQQIMQGISSGGGGEGGGALQTLSQSLSAIDLTGAVAQLGALTEAANSAAQAGSALQSAFQQGLQNIPTDADNAAQAMGRLAEAAKQAAQAVQQATGFSGGGFSGFGFAGGGPVWGPGTSTSDSIRARLSRGEFVINARAVKHWGVDLFHALNGMVNPGVSLGSMRGGVPSFAGGGLVGAGGGGRAIHLTIDGQTFKGLSAPRDVASKLVTFAMQRQAASGGKKPSWYGGGSR